MPVSADPTEMPRHTAFLLSYLSSAISSLPDEPGHDVLPFEIKDMSYYR